MDYPVSDPTVGLVGGKFTDGNPAGGVPASRDPAGWANLISDELIGIVVAAGLVPSDADNTQVLQALVLLGLRAATTADAGVVKLADGPLVQGGVDAGAAATPAALLAGLLGAGGTSAFDYVTVPYRDKTTGDRRNLIIQWGSISATVTANANNSAAFPVTFPVAVMQVIGWNGDVHTQPSATVGLDYSSNPPTVAGFTWRSNVAGANRITFIAIGR